jgi:intracellular septation protein A
MEDERGTPSLLEGDRKQVSSQLLRAAGPRLLRDTLGPTLSFYGGWKLSGNLVVGIALGSGFALGAYWYERRHGRPGLIARLVLVFVVVQAVIGLTTDSAQAYLVQPAILGSINGLVWLGSVAIGRPLAGVFASEVFPVDDDSKGSDEFRTVFRHVTLVFGVFFVVFAAIQVSVLLAVGVDAFVAVRVVDAVGVLALIVYAVRYAVDRLDLAALSAEPAPSPVAD